MALSSGRNWVKGCSDPRGCCRNTEYPCKKCKTVKEWIKSCRNRCEICCKSGAWNDFGSWKPVYYDVWYRYVHWVCNACLPSVKLRYRHLVTTINERTLIQHLAPATFRDMATSGTNSYLRMLPLDVLAMAHALIKTSLMTEQEAKEGAEMTKLRSYLNV